VLEASADELEAAGRDGELTDAKTLIGLLWLRQWRGGRWPLEWRPRPPEATRIMPA
jgi:ADP-ribose pyrophosphatase